MTWSFWIKLGVKILGTVINLVTPEIRDLMREMLQNGYDKAKLTDNPWDDFLFKTLASLLGIELKE